MSPEHPDDLQVRILALLDGTLEQDEVTRLDAELRDSREARVLFRQLATLHSSLEDQGLSQSDLDCAPVIPIELLLARQRRRVVKTSLLAAAAVLVISAIALWVNMVPEAPPATIAGFQAAPNSVFMLSHAGDGEKLMGNVLAEGSSVLLEHGVAELNLPHEVRAVIEAPAAMTLIDERTLQLDHGRGFFQVSSADGKGFTVRTPHQQIVDLGTAFGVDASSKRDGVELHVFEGRVRVDALDGTEGKTIKAKRSVLLAGTRVDRDLDGPPAAFFRQLPAKVDTLLHEDFESGLVAGRDYAVQIDPTAIRDLEGNRFPGIADDKTWNFATLSNPAAIPIPNPSFEAGTPPAEWGPADWSYTGGAAGRYDAATGRGLSCTNGSCCLWINGDQTVYQDTGVVIEDGKTYTLNVDIGGAFWSGNTATFRLYGSTLGFGTALGGAERSVVTTAATWDQDEAINFTATAADSGQTLGIALTVTGTQAVFDNVRLEVPCHTDGDDLPDSFELAHTDPPSATALRPGDDLENDGLTNLQEFQHGTNPRNPDTDGDGVSDGAELTAGTDPTAPPAPDGIDDLPATERDTAPPFIALFHPADDATDVMPTGGLTMTFNEPIKFGTGRIFLRNITDWVQTEIAVDGPRASIDGRVLTITPPADLADGDIQMGRIGGWECNAWAGVFNPGGEGRWYVADGLKDKGQGRGTIGSMRGPVMGTFGGTYPGTGIRRVFGSITPDSRYTVSVAVGVRTESADQAATFDGYTIRLISGATVLADLTDDTPPGPPNSVTTVGFSWNSSTLPEGLAPGDPLALEIAPNDASGLEPGYLDLDNVRVTVVGE